MGVCSKWLKFIILMGATALVFSSSLYAGDVIRFVYFEQFEPFSWSENGKMKGIFVDVVNEVFKHHLNVEVRHEGLPWKRAQQMVQSGEADGMCTISTHERLRYCLPTDYPVVETEFRIFAGVTNPRLKALKEVKTLEDLSGFALIDILGSGWAEMHLGKMGVHYEPTYSRVFELLANGRYDASVRNNTQTKYLIKKLGFEGKIIELQQPMVPESQSYRILISKKSVYSDRLKEINAALRKISENGTLSLIGNRYP